MNTRTEIHRGQQREVPTYQQPFNMPSFPRRLCLGLILLAFSSAVDAFVPSRDLPSSPGVTASADSLGLVEKGQAPRACLPPLRMSKKNSPKVVTAQPPRPHENCYWVTDSFMAGEFPSDRSNNEAKTRQKLKNYLQCGITCFVDLTQEGEKPNYEKLVQDEASKLGMDNVAVQRFAIPDFGIPDNKDTMRDILNAIDTAIETQQHKVYVHCRGGIGRTGTTVGCYLARHGYNGEEALKEVNRLFQTSGRSMESYYSPETNEQMNFVRDWKES